MKKFLSISLAYLLLINQCFAASGSGNISSIASVGGGTSILNSVYSLGINPSVTIPEGSLSNYMTLHGDSNAGNSGQYMSLYTGQSNTQYQVASGKKFYIVMICAINRDTSVNLTYQPGFATASFTNQTTSAPTGAVYWGGAANIRIFNVFGTGGGSVMNCLNESNYFPALSYPFMNETSSVAASFIVYGKEQ